MAHKVFASYKFGDNQVYQEGLNSKYWAEGATEATVRGYLNWIEEVVGEKNIYKGESDGESLEGKTLEQIWSYLKPRVYDSSVTLVVISPQMRDLYKEEEKQWMPQEIRYSLWEVDRGGRTSTTNGLLGVVLPDRNNRYDYVYQKSDCPNCQNISIINRSSLFGILAGNIFNKKGDNGLECNDSSCYTVRFSGDHSYMPLVKFPTFMADPHSFIKKAFEIREKGDEYEIEKTI